MKEGLSTNLEGSINFTLNYTKISNEKKLHEIIHRGPSHKQVIQVILRRGAGADP